MLHNPSIRVCEYMCTCVSAFVGVGVHLCVCMHVCVRSCMHVRITGTVTVAAYTDMLYLFGS